MPKPVSGEKAGARGVLGSIAKPAQSRAVHLLTRVPPKDVQGRHVLRWEATKMSYSALPEPFGVELRFKDKAVFINATDLPEDYGDTRTAKAMRAMQNHLETNRGLVIDRQTLLDVAIREGNLRKRASVDALKKLTTDLDTELITVTLPGNGQPLGYRLKTES